MRVWHVIFQTRAHHPNSKPRQADKEKKGQQRLLLFPQAKMLYDAGMMEQLADHLDLCKEVRATGVAGLHAMHTRRWMHGASPREPYPILNSTLLSHTCIHHRQVCEILGESQNAVSMHPSAAGAYQAPVPAILVKPLPVATMGFSDVRQMIGLMHGQIAYTCQVCSSLHSTH